MTGIPPEHKEQDYGQEKGRQEVLTQTLPRTKRIGRLEQEAGALSPASFGNGKKGKK
jgi:hypothetical protein